MRYSLSRALALVFLLAAVPASAQVRIDQLGSAAAASGGDIIPDCQTCNSSTPAVGLTITQLTTYMNTNLSLNASIITAGTLPVARGGTGITSFGTGVATWLGTPSSANLLSALTTKTGTGNAVFSIAPTITGAPTFTGVPILSGLSAGTQVSCLGLDSGNGIVLNAAACGSGGGGSTLTANSTATSGYSAGTFLYSDGSVIQVGTFGTGLSLTGGTLNASGSSASGVGVAGGESVSTINNTSSTLAAGHYIVNTVTAQFSAARTTTLPTAAAFGAHIIHFYDNYISGTGCAINGANVWNIKPNGTDTINGVTGTGGQVVLNVPCSGLDLYSDGTSNWTPLGQFPAGTAGAVPYYSAAGQVAASSALASGALVIGGGASGPSTTTTGTGVVTALGVNVGSAGAFVAFNGALGTPSSGTLTSAIGLPISTGVSGLGTGIATALAINAGSAGAPLLNTVAREEAIGWPAAVNPNNNTIFIAKNASTITAIIGDVEVATGGTATVSLFKAPSGTACSGGTVLHSGSFNANGTAATNQTLTVTTSSLSAGDRVCLQTTGTTTWTGGTGVGGITVSITTP